MRLFNKSRDAHLKLINQPWLFLNFQELYQCCLFKMQDDPTQCDFSAIEQLNGKSAVILYDGSLYYANQKNQTVTKIESEHTEKLQKEFTDNSRLVNSLQLGRTVNEITDCDHLIEKPLSYAEFLDIAHELFQTPFTSFREFGLQCAASLLFTLLLLAYTMLVSLCTIIVTVVTPLVVIHNLCSGSVDDAKSNTMLLLDMFVTLGDLLLKTVLSIPLQAASLLVRGGLTLLPESADETPAASNSMAL